MNTYLQGMVIGGGLIVAIGAQNAFVLTQGIRKQYNWLVAFICSASDVFLIFIGAAGLGATINSYPKLQVIAAWGGAAFLFYIGLQALLDIRKDKSLETGNIQPGIRAIVASCLAFTFLNPHVYVDTVLLLGSIGGQFPERERLVFALGASTSSFLWFFGLSLCGTLLAPFFKKKVAWKILDLLVCITMWIIAYQLLPLWR